VGILRNGNSAIIGDIPKETAGIDWFRQFLRNNK
jgi:hypothetical protein